MRRGIILPTDDRKPLTLRAADMQSLSKTLVQKNNKQSTKPQFTSTSAEPKKENF